MRRIPLVDEKVKLSQTTMDQEFEKEKNLIKQKWKEPEDEETT